MYLFYLPFGLSIIVNTTAETSRYEFVSPFSLMMGGKKDIVLGIGTVCVDMIDTVSKYPNPDDKIRNNSLSSHTVITVLGSYGSIFLPCVCVCVTVCVCVCVLLNVLYESELTEAHTVITVSSETRLSMSGGKTRCNWPSDTTTEDALMKMETLHHSHREATRCFLMTVREGATDAQIADAVYR